MQDLDPVVEKSKIWHKGSVPIRSKSARLILSNKFERFGLKIRIIYK